MVTFRTPLYFFFDMKRFLFVADLSQGHYVYCFWDLLCPVGKFFKIHGSESKHRLHRQFLSPLNVVQRMPCFSFASANTRSIVSLCFASHKWVLHLQGVKDDQLLQEMTATYELSKISKVY